MTSEPAPPIHDETYLGQELDLFAAVHHWKAYFAAQMGPFLGPRVIEVGAGLGATARALFDADPGRAGRTQEWLCLEPDAGLRRRLEAALADDALPACCRVVAGTLASLPATPDWDTVLYADVLEHIEDDRSEVARAAARLAPGGHLVVLAPAHDWLFTPFDHAIGHFRRYDRRRFRDIAPPGVDEARLRYLDAVGMLASAGNRFVLSSDLPSARQLWLWDRLMVPLSRLVDPLFGHRLGKSILAVWRKR
jgi:SAM-dependent methyltransferase